MILAIDCDLRMSYAVNDHNELGARDPNPVKLISGMLDDTVPGIILFEIASPVSFNRGAAGHAAMTMLAKWAIWNAAQAARINAIFGDYHHIRVAPSNVWTKGYDLKTRHAMCKAKQPKKDLRECEAMIWFYQKDPSAWKTLPDYLATL